MFVASACHRLYVYQSVLLCVYTYIHSRALGLLSKGLFGGVLRKTTSFSYTTTIPDTCTLSNLQQSYSTRQDISIMAPKPIKLYSHAGVSTDLAIPIAN